jgi:hypothetical protein
VALTRRNVLVAEAKFTERGFGRCSCPGRSSGRCSARVLERPYWATANKSMGLRRRHASGRCSLSLAYQPVRNVAAAKAIAVGRAATFLLLYDERNPYFAGTEEWPGWVSILQGLMRFSDVVFESLSWQALLGRVRLDPQVLRWAAQKHDLRPRERRLCPDAPR